MASVAAFVLSGVLLSIVQWKVTQPKMLLLERFVPGAGWIEILLLAVYAAIVCHKMLDPKNTRRVRLFVWKLFSFVFFAQFILGILGVESLLMTGELHLPIPALIVSGPLYRGEGFFMLILFCSTVLLVGPAWCSQLCYIGSWDDWAARRQKRPGRMPKRREVLRVCLFLVIVVITIGLRLYQATPMQAGVIAVSFAVVGLGLMMFWSTQNGNMTHCLTYCPIGLLTVLLAKLNPFRLRINADCEECGVCTNHCRYGALEKKQLLRRRVGLTCTLCGDCIASCKSNSLAYWFPGLNGSRARAVYLVLVVSVHAVFLGVARL